MRHSSHVGAAKSGLILSSPVVLQKTSLRCSARGPYRLRLFSSIGSCLSTTIVMEAWGNYRFEVSLRGSMQLMRLFIFLPARFRALYRRFETRVTHGRRRLSISELNALELNPLFLAVDFLIDCVVARFSSFAVRRIAHHTSVSIAKFDVGV